MAEWRREVYPLKDDHNWKIRPGYKILIADRGSVRFEFPAHWTLEPGDDTMKLRDQPEPNDNCLLQVSVFYLPLGIDWSRLTLRFLVEDSNKIEEREVIRRGKIITGRRPHLEYAWQETRVVDPTEKREVISRFLLARGENIPVLITMDYWPEYAKEFGPVWDHLLHTIRIGEYVADPSRQPMN